MLSWSDLRKCSLNKKVEELYKHGTFVTAIRYYHHKVNLYLLGSDYIEVFINHKKAIIDKIDLLDRSHSRMKFYSDQIKLTL
ncbi:MAG: hypothetical protein OJF59_001187 [Cytophagales bacterium]|jgi:hypothetical protein|nr:hypothetical protein [Bacteroidota bacterium]MBS1981816.1 hypothetical protein [Bacteroidota bacterium]WHZ07434.1 MAG: hypothetical protein OJF59_001187 [Cytophagales bacterium]